MYKLFILICLFFQYVCFTSKAQSTSNEFQEDDCIVKEYLADSIMLLSTYCIVYNLDNEVVNKEYVASLIKDIDTFKLINLYVYTDNSIAKANNYGKFPNFERAESVAQLIRANAETYCIIKIEPTTNPKDITIDRKSNLKNLTVFKFFLSKKK